MKKRKRSSDETTSNKRPCSSSSYTTDHVSRLAKYYYTVETLGDHLLKALPSTSKLRRRRLLELCKGDSDVSRLLQGVLVGGTNQTDSAAWPELRASLQQFTQTQSITASSTGNGRVCSIEHVVGFAIWILFKRKSSEWRKQQHLLCHGFEQSVAGLPAGATTFEQAILLPGIAQRRRNPCITALQHPSWTQLLELVGRDGELIFGNLFIHYALFSSSQADASRLQQLTGLPFHDLCMEVTQKETAAFTGTTVHRSPQSITFVRSRMFYSKPQTNRDGTIQFGLKHMHVLNRLRDLGSHYQNCIIVRYVFPRQFKMHNVFTSTVDRRQTVQTFKDYTFREEEIDTLARNTLTKLPKRLRGSVLGLISGLRRLHAQCSYSQLLMHHCPSFPAKQPKSTPVAFTAAPLTGDDTKYQPQISLNLSPPNAGEGEWEQDEVDTSFLHYATPVSGVVSFVTAAVRRILPKHTFGSGESGRRNWRHILRWTAQFVRMRRFETISLHALSQSLRQSSIHWLAAHPQGVTRATSSLEKQKREQILHEFLYYLFDSIIIPLIACNFYVTESALHRNQLLYFRHDVWQRLCQPTLATFKLGSLVPIRGVSSRTARNSLLSPSLCRLLPKENGTRMITNLKRRTMQKASGRYILQPSTNTRLAPVFDIFRYEQRHHDNPAFALDGGSIRSICHQLASFRQHVTPGSAQSWYFVKVDIQSAFDSIPQDSLLELMDGIFRQSRYQTVKHATIKYGKGSGITPRVKFSTHIEDDVDDGPGNPAGVSSKSALVVENMVNSCQAITTTQARALLHDHVKYNTLKVGKKLYRQSLGIPQGSVLSSMLCTFFYNHFERSRLGFLDSTKSLLLRVIDDFLLITTSRSQARHFLTAMARGDADFGIKVHPQKSLVNFDVDIGGVQVPKVPAQAPFTYCGLSINTRTLSVSKDRVRKDNIVSNALTVDLHGRAGEKLVRRLISSLQIQLQHILLSPQLNDKGQVIQTLIECYQETTMKMHRYLVSMPPHQRPSQQLIIRLVQKLIVQVTRLVGQSQATLTRFTRPQIQCIAAMGIHAVLSQKRTRYEAVLQWLDHLRRCTMFSLDLPAAALGSLAAKAHKATSHYRF